ncbi:creatininase family protein [Niabella aurantiaca]|uniref:creatininase family protein n=1 Tax=Niabella aurantiaca TaxID=379900 RepID=UPI000377DF29|nr:creatininase family protein [Niabella aurantiaca]
MIWDQLTSAQIGALDKNIPVLLPLTATEQHGGHLPLATDRLIGEHFAHCLHTEMSGTVLILPAINVGCSDHHMDFPGTLSLTHGTFLLVVKEMIVSVLRHGFNKIILLNSHGGNQGIMNVVAEQLGYENPGTHIVTVTWWVLAQEALRKITETGPGGTGHACEFETSLIQLIANHLVDNASIQKGQNMPAFTWAEGDMLRGPAASYYRTFKSKTSNGIYGNPLKASAQKGQQITTTVVHALKQIVIDIYRINEQNL